MKSKFRFLTPLLALALVACEKFPQPSFPSSTNSSDQSSSSETSSPQKETTSGESSSTTSDSTSSDSTSSSTTSTGPVVEEKATVIVSSDIVGGEISLDGYGTEAEVPLGTEIHLLATPDDGYALTSLTVNEQSVLSTFSFVAEEQTTYLVKAQFTKKETTVSKGTIRFSGLEEDGAISLTEDNLLLENVDVSAVSSSGLYHDSDLDSSSFRMATSKNAGMVTFCFSEEITIEEVVLHYEPYHNDTPEVTVSTDSQSLAQGESSRTYNFGGELTSLLKIQCPSGKRIILSGIDISFKEIEVVPVPATISITKEGEGDVTISPSEDFMVGDTITVTATPKEGHYLSHLTLNDANGKSLGNNRYSFVIKDPANTLSAIFRERGTSTEDYSYLYVNEKIFPDRGNQTVDIDSYYEPIRGLSGLALKEGLHEIIDDHESFSYSSANNSLPVIDADPFESGKVHFIYQSELKNKGTSFNKEHTWAKSHGDFGTREPMGSDLHNLRMCFNNLNSTRSNLDFGTVSHSSSTSVVDKYDWAQSDMEGNYRDSNYFEPQDEWKGDVARIIFYMATRYDGDSGEVDLEVSGDIDTTRFYDFTSGADGLHGNFANLYEWATSGIDPVDDYEVSRNNVCDQEYQHNRNPFIDHPEFIIMIYDKNYDGPGALM